MALDPSKISIVSSKKTTFEEFSLKNKVDRLAPTKPVANATAVAPHVNQPSLAVVNACDLSKELPETKCHACCMAQGSLIAALTCFAVSAVGMGVYIFAEKRVNYTLNGVMRQIAWLTIPGTLVGTTLHFFLTESMWSGKRGSWGQSWIKAFFANTLVWCAAIGISTGCWRYGLKLTKRGKQLQHKYPIPTDPLETRMMRSGKNFVANMGWSYWLSGVASGQFGFFSTVGFCVFNDRPHYLMAPHGGYAMRCMPKWRRDFIEKNAIK